MLITSIFDSGKIVEDVAFRDGRFIWPEGYTAVRKFTSFTGETFFIELSYSFGMFFERSVKRIIFFIYNILILVVLIL